MKHRVIGIDLGTTYSAVAAYDPDEDEAAIIRDADGQETTPSVVGLDRASGRAVVGHVAKRGLAGDPENTIIEIKREMGELFREETLDRFRARGLYRATRPAAPGTGDPGEKGDPVRASLAGEWYLPQEVSALVLMKMKEVAEREIGEEVRDAVITVPAYFTANQRKATEEAALLAGLYPRQLIPEPTAAAICFGLDRGDPVRRVYMVYDLGGGTFDVSIIDVQGGDVTVLATAGDPRLGGGDFDDEITRWAANELRRRYTQLELGPADLARIKFQAEEAKKRLATFDRTELVFAWPGFAEPPRLTLERAEFERMIEPYLSKSLSSVEEARNAAREKGIDALDAILLVGGSTKIPRVRARLLEYFGADADFIRSEVNPDAVVARGAALLASRFQPSPPPFDIRNRPRENRLVPADAADPIGGIQLITEFSLGVGTAQERVQKIVRQGTNIPATRTEGGFTNTGPTEYVHVPIYQGEGDLVYENTLIGELQLGPMTRQERGFHQFEVTFELDLNGLLSVMVRHVNENKTYQARFEHETSVKGEDALIRLRDRLQGLYLSSEQGAPTPPPPDYRPPPPVTIPLAVDVFPPPHASVPAPGPAVPGVEGQAGDEVVVPAGESGAPAATAVLEVVEPTVELPEAFRSVVRRARKQLLRVRSPDLILALNALVVAINEGRPEEDLVRCGEALEDLL